MANNLEEARYESLSTLPANQKKETSAENRLATTTRKAGDGGDERIGLDEDDDECPQDSYHLDNIQGDTVSKTSTKLVDDASNCSKITSRQPILEKRADNNDPPSMDQTNSNEELSHSKLVKRPKSIGRDEQQGAFCGQQISTPEFDRLEHSSTPGSTKSQQERPVSSEHQHYPMHNVGLSGMPAQIYPYGPYFANPFMAPFVAHLPQAQQNNDFSEIPAPEVISGRNGRIGSYNNAEFIAHAKYYRELLEQYLRTMDSATYVPGAEIGESTLSSAVNLKFDPDTGLAKMTLTEDPGFGANIDQSSENRLNRDAQIEQADDSPLKTPANNGSQGGTETSSTDNSRHEGEQPRDETSLEKEVAASSSESPSVQPDDSDISTAALIKKQISEIEKQILRNVQNQNTRKMDSKEVEAFLLDPKSASCTSGQAKTDACEQSLQGSPSPDASQTFGPRQFGPKVDRRSLYERAAASASFQPHHQAPGYIDPYFGQATSAYHPSALTWQPNFFYPGCVPSADSFYAGQFGGRMPFGQMPIYGSAIGGLPYSYAIPQNHTYNTAAAPQTAEPEKTSDFRPEQAQEPMANRSSVRNEALCVAAVEMSAPSSSSSSSALSSLDGTPLKSVENLRKFLRPTDSASIDSIGSFRETNDNEEDGRWASQDRRSSGHHADDEEEPVWVLRESYVRKLKREEERKAQKERYESKRLEQNQLESADKAMADSDDNETDKLLSVQQQNGNVAAAEAQKLPQKKAKKKKEVMVHEPAVLIEGVLFRARYLGSTQLACDGRPSKSTRMMQAQEAVGRIKAPDDEHQPFTDVDLFISTEKIMVLNADLQDSIMMDHPLRTISYIADIGDLVVLMARRVSQSSPDSPESVGRRTPKIMCHVFESDEAQFIAQSIGQAFQVAYMEFLRANGIEDSNCMRDVDYQEVLNAQEMFGEELEMFARKETERDVVIPKQKNEILGVVIVESGWGSMLPTVVIANLMPSGPAARSNQLNIGDHIITINGISLVGLPLSECQTHIRSVRHLTAVKLTVVRTAPVVEVRMRRPDTKYQLGFSVQNGVICSLLRGGIGERGGVRVGHRIIEINSQSVVAVPHETIVTILASAVGEIHMKTMPTSMYRLLTGQETPNYL